MGYVADAGFPAADAVGMLPGVLYQIIKRFPRESLRAARKNGSCAYMATGRISSV
jgi:hypothetical protein